MFEVNGKYSSAKIFTDLVEQEAIAQVINMCSQPFAENANVRIMPDVHAGAGCTVGTTMRVTDKACPNIVGVDQGCGMHVAKLDLSGTDGKLDLPKLDAALHGYGMAPIVPSGFDIRDKAHPLVKRLRLGELICMNSVNLDRAEKSIGTLGGGNHFVEINHEPETGDYYLVVHTGSRHLGIEVCKYYQNKAAKMLAGPTVEQRQAVIDALKAEGRQREIPDALAKLAKEHPAVNKDIAWCEGPLFDDYIHDMEIAQEFAHWNRVAIVRSICEYMGYGVFEEFKTIHNYIDTKNMILRKGAVSAQKGEKLIIPMNMRDGSLICVGKGNPDWNYSAPHGAGRLMSRSKAKELLSMTEFEHEMEGIYTTSVVESTLDESPMAYKPMEAIVENVQDTVDIVSVIKPVYNFKAAE